GDKDGRVNPDPVAGQDVVQVIQGYYPAATDGILGRRELVIRGALRPRLLPRISIFTTEKKSKMS
ncbi:MAG: hypothetical protein AAFP00_04795, partial [Bacteroidota bacterium]